MKRAVIYIRTSTPSAIVVKAQHDTCLEFCQHYNLEVVGTLVETGQGLTLDDRPKLDELRHMIGQRRMDAIIVHTVDRLARGFEPLAVLVSEAEDCKVEIHSATEVSMGEQTPLRVAAMMAERERLAILLRNAEDETRHWQLRA